MSTTYDFGSLNEYNVYFICLVKKYKEAILGWIFKQGALR